MLVVIKTLDMNRYVCIKTHLYILPEISGHHLQLKCMGGHFSFFVLSDICEKLCSLFKHSLFGHFVQKANKVLFMESTLINLHAQNGRQNHKRERELPSKSNDESTYHRRQKPSQAEGHISEYG